MPKSTLIVMFATSYSSARHRLLFWQLNFDQKVKGKICSRNIDTYIGYTAKYPMIYTSYKRFPLLDGHFL